MDIPMRRMPFGKYKGEFLGNVPDEYLEWAETIVTSERLREAIRADLDHRAFIRSLGHRRLFAESLRARMHRG